ncbi:MAG: response regulator, partial [Spartobacteria bacterium]|nr:response regulator [Spartobacteria bacterium]
ASDAAHTEAEVRDADVNGYLTRPVKLPVLRAMLSRIYGVKGMAPVARGAERAAEQDWRRLRGMRVILAEDNVINQEVAIENLSSVGIHVDVAIDGMQVLKMVGDGNYDAVLMDIQMPDMDGYEATRKIRMMDAAQHGIPIIAMTAHAMTGDREKCMEAGMNGYVTKPIEPAHLFAEINRCVEDTHFAEDDRPLDEEQDASASPSPPEAEAYTKEGFPCLEGFDVETGIQRVRGNAGLYRKLLLDFVRRNETTCRDMAEAFEKGDTAALKKMAHTLKGTAGNLSAIALQNAARNLEDALGQRHMEDVEVRLAQWVDVWESVLQAMPLVETLPEPENEVGDADGALDTEQIPGMMRELEEMLSRGSVDAEQLIRELHPAFERAQCREDARAMEQQMSDFDYKGAQETLLRLAEKMGIPLTGK